MADPTFTADGQTRPACWVTARAMADHPEGARVAVIIRGTGEHVLTLAEARALRASLDAAITAASPPRALCRYDDCDQTATHGPDGVAVVCWSHAWNWPEVTRG